jgi:nucleotide-binding universal stress UspA family protein
VFPLRGITLQQRGVAMTTRSTGPMRILLATDDSVPAQTAESWIVRLRWADSPIVDVVTVAGRGMTRLGWGLGVDRETLRHALDTVRQSERIEAERIANEVGERLQYAGLTVHTWARQGDCSEQLLTMIDDERPDLVVVGPRGRSALAQVLLGSVTQQMVTQASAPVLVARPSVTPDGPLPRHILVVADGARHAESAIAWLLDVGWVRDARVTVVGLLGERTGLGSDEPELVDEIAGMVRSDATETLGVLIQPLVDAGVDVGLELRDGHPLQAVLDSAMSLDVDLVAVARAPRRRDRDALAEKVARHAGASVLLFPAP